MISKRSLLLSAASFSRLHRLQSNTRYTCRSMCLANLFSRRATSVDARRCLRRRICEAMERREEEDVTRFPSASSWTSAQWDEAEWASHAWLVGRGALASWEADAVGVVDMVLRVLFVVWRMHGDNRLDNDAVTEDTSCHIHRNSSCAAIHRNII